MKKKKTHGVKISRLNEKGPKVFWQNGTKPILFFYISNALLSVHKFFSSVNHVYSCVYFLTHREIFPKS